MRASFSIGRVFGIDIKLHATFALIVLFGAIQGAMLLGSTGIVVGIALVLALFLCVTLHELGHALAARRFGIGTREIVLWPLGGVAILMRQPSRPLHELVIALAGPAVNVAIAALLVVGGLASGVLPRGLADLLALSTDPQGLAGAFLWLIGANVALVVFNLIPALPMDGGRVLRALLQMALGADRATFIAARVGQAAALGMVGFGLWNGNILLAAVGVFVLLGASQELALRRTQRALRGWTLGDLVARGAPTLGPADLLSDAVRVMLATRARDVAVLHGGRFLGVLSRRDVEAALANDPRERYVSELARRDVMVLPAELTLDEASQRMAERWERVAAVVQNDRVVGVVSVESLADAAGLARPSDAPDSGDRAAA